MSAGTAVKAFAVGDDKIVVNPDAVSASVALVASLGMDEPVFNAEIPCTVVVATGAAVVGTAAIIADFKAFEPGALKMVAKPVAVIASVALVASLGRVEPVFKAEMPCTVSVATGVVPPTPKAAIKAAFSAGVMVVAKLSVNALPTSVQATTHGTPAILIPI
jgi:hypothetical protein